MKSVKGDGAKVKRRRDGETERGRDEWWSYGILE